MPVTVLAQSKKIKHVIVIGVDGLGSHYMQAAKTPVMDELMKNGSYSLKARCIRPSSSACNWAAMMMGAGPELTGYTKWDSRTPEIPSRVLDEYGMFPTIYGALHQQKSDATIGVIYSWGGIGYLFPKEAVNKNEHTGKDSLTELSAARYIKEVKPDFLFLHFDEVDGAGHTIGWETDAYTQAVETIDARIGKIWKAVQDAGIMNETVILVSSDHGGIKKGHGGDSLAEMEIPWIIYGAGIKKITR